MTATPAPDLAARATFQRELGPRVAALRVALSALLGGDPSAGPAAGEQLLRRARGLGLAARSLGFDQIGALLDDVERALAQGAAHGLFAADQLDGIARALDELTLLAYTAPAAARLPRVACVGGSERAQALADETRGALDVRACDDIDDPAAADVAVIEAGAPSAATALAALSAHGVPALIVGDRLDDASRARWVAAGARRVLSTPASARSVAEAVVEVALRPVAAGDADPLGALSVEQLVERLKTELDAGLAGGANDPARPIDLGAGSDVLAAIWSAVARVRETVTLRSGGAVRFDPDAPSAALGAGSAPSRERRRAGTAARQCGDVLLEGRRVVVVDDDPAIVWFVASVLQEAGVEVLEAHDGCVALDLCERHSPDAVVADVLMPGLDGIALCKHLKRDVALRDVPVVLLSWKDDLLQRARELGAAADGFLTKEARGSVMVERLREVLRPRARVELRLASETEVHGRVEGLSPRLLLTLLAERKASACLTVADGTASWEVELRRGRPLCATRSLRDGSTLRGEPALASLLGVSTARFRVTPSESAARRDFHGELVEILAAPIARARDAQRHLAPDRLLHVQRLRLDEAALAPVVEATPEPARGLLRRLLAGETPRRIAQRDPGVVGLLELLVDDLARRGAVTQILIEAPPGSGPRAREVTVPAGPVALAPPREATPFVITPLGASPALVEVESVSLPNVGASVQPPLAAPDGFSFALSHTPPPLANAPEPALDAATLRGLGDPRVDALVGKPRPVVVRAPTEHGLFTPVCAPSPSLLLDAQPTPFAPELASDSMPKPLAAHTRDLYADAPGDAPEPPVASSPPPAYVTDRPPAVAPTLAAPAQARPSFFARARGAVGGLAVVGATGFAAHYGVSALLAPSTVTRDVRASAPAPVDPSTLATAQPSASAAASAKAEGAPEFDQQTMELPPGVSVEPNHGLVEIDSGGAHAVYIDESFVGRGPLRRVPLEAGSHALRLELGGNTTQAPIEVVAGKRLRVGFVKR